MKKYLFFIILIVILLSVLGYLIFRVYQYSSNLSSLKSELAASQEKSGTGYDVKSALNKWDNDLKEMDGRLINKDLPLEFIKSVEESAKTAGVKSEISPSSSKDDKGVWPAISFQVSAEGEFSKLMRFVNLIETGHYLTEITNLNFSQTGKSELRAAMSIKVFSK